jgi:hypothetical protein
MKARALAATLVTLGLLAAVLALVLLRLPSRQEAPPPPPQVSQPQPPPTLEPPDFETTRRLGLEDIRPYYDKLADHIANYKSVVVRTHLEFPLILKEQTFEAEFWLDAIRPNRFAHRLLCSQREDKSDWKSKWTFRPLTAEASDGANYQMISFAKKNLHKVDLTAADKPSQAVVGPTKIKCASQFLNPLQDLLFGVDITDRFKEVVDAKWQRTSEREEARAVHRLNRRMLDVIASGRLVGSLPINSEVYQTLALREDVFDTKTGDLVKVLYYDQNRSLFIQQVYMQIEWDTDIPEDRFELEAPEGSSTHDINAILRRNHARALRGEDVQGLTQKGILPEPLPAPE